MPCNVTILYDSESDYKNLCLLAGVCIHIACPHDT